MTDTAFAAVGWIASEDSKKDKERKEFAPKKLVLGLKVVRQVDATL